MVIIGRFTGILRFIPRVRKVLFLRAEPCLFDTPRITVIVACQLVDNGPSQQRAVHREAGKRRIYRVVHTWKAY